MRRIPAEMKLAYPQRLLVVIVVIVVVTLVIVRVDVATATAHIVVFIVVVIVSRTDEATLARKDELVGAVATRDVGPRDVLVFLNGQKRLHRLRSQARMVARQRITKDHCGGMRSTWPG